MKPGRSRFVLATLLLATGGMLACNGDDGGAQTDATGTDTGEGPTSDTGSETDTGGEPESNLLEVAGATFMMGCGAGDTDCDSDNPSHDVSVSSFYIERTEVSVAAYQSCVDGGGCSAASSDPDCNFGNAARADHPINCVTWQQAVDYCEWMGRRLPTEAEWELAAGGPESRTFPWGSGPASCDLAHMFSVVNEMGDYGCMTGMTAPVESYENGAALVGALQMAGNVDEWVADWFATDYYSSGEDSDPQGPSDGTQKVNRGGDLFDASALNLRVFERRNSNPDAVAPEHGFRCAADSP